VKNGKSAQKVNGISVSKTPKIGERPYPRPFHPVEIRGKITKIHVNHTKFPRQTHYKRLSGA